MALNDVRHELEIYQQLATAVGETLEAVCNMQEQEREQLITVLGLRGDGNNKEWGFDVEDKSTIQVVENARPILIEEDDTVDDMMKIVDLVLEMEKEHESIMKEEDNNLEVKENIVVESEDGKNDPNNNERQVDITVVEPPGNISLEVNPKLISLQQDAELVLRLLGGDRGPAVNGDLVLAYLEAHMDKVDRVQVVVEELAGMENDSQTPERQPSVEMTWSEKGKGKSSKLVNSFDLGSRLADVRKRSLGSPHTLAGGLPKKPRLDAENLLEQTPFHTTVPILAALGPSTPTPPPVSVSSSQPGPSIPTQLPAPATLIQLGPRTPPLLGPRTPPLLGPRTPPLLGPRTPPLLGTRTPPLLGPRTPPLLGPRTPRLLGPRTPPLLGPRTPPPSGPRTPPPPGPGTPPPPGPRTPPPPGPKTPPPPGPKTRPPPQSSTPTQQLPGPSNPTLPIVTTENPATTAAISSLVDSLSDMFPQTPLDYLRVRCRDLVGREAAVDRFTEELLTSQAPPAGWRQMYSVPSLANQASPAKAGPSSVEATRYVAEQDQSPIMQWEEEKHGEMLSMFPTICPQYLLTQVQAVSRVEGRLSSGEVTKNNIIAFQSMVERIWAMTPEVRRQLATRSWWEQKEKERAELEKWSGKMSPGDFLDMYNDPAKYFNTKREVSEEYNAHALADLKGRFRFQNLNNITRVFGRCGFLLSKTVKQLNQAEISRKSRRPDFECKTPGGPPCITFLKEKKFMDLEVDIGNEKLRRAQAYEQKMASAKLAGVLVECECCYDPECLEEEMLRCGGGHLYCRDCVETSTKAAMGEGKTIMECLGQCDEEITWEELSRALPANVMSKLIQKRQAVEVEKAGLDGVVACPYCPYLTIMENIEDKVLVCRNPDCGRESCRLCREPNHIPLRCDEVEKGEQARKMIEEKLTQAMLRECAKCKNKFYKEEGCNKMTCRCGARMCYLCKKEAVDYSHFYGQGGTPTTTKTCPLWSDNKILHQMEVAKAAEQAKQQLTEDNVTLSIDPTRDIVMPADISASEYEIRDRLFNRWLDVNTMVARVTDAPMRGRLQLQIENIRKNHCWSASCHLGGQDHQGPGVSPGTSEQLRQINILI